MQRYQSIDDHMHELQHFSHQSHDMDFLASVHSPNTFSVLSG